MASQRDREVLRSFARRINPNDASAHNNLGVLYYNKGMYLEAVATFQRALELDPDMQEAQANLDAAAAAAAAAAVADAPPDAPPDAPADSDPFDSASPPSAMEVTREAALTHYNLGQAFRKQAKYAEALREYELAVQAGEDRDLMEQATAEVHLLRRDAAEALRLYDGLLTRQPQSPKLLNERGVALHQSGRYQEAQASYLAAIASDPSYALAHNNLGVALYHGGNPTGANAAFQHALDAQPTFAKARLNQALLFFKGKRFPQALGAFQTVLATEAENPVAWNGVGLVLAESRKFQEAKSAYARAIQARPKYAEAHYNLSFALSNLGDFEAALRETKLAIELEPYYVPQKLELAIDLQYEDPGLSMQPDLGQERRVDAVEEFAFEPGAFDALFKELGHGAPLVARSEPAATAATAAGANAFALAADLLTKGFVERAQSEVTRALAAGGDRVRGGTLLGDTFLKRSLWGEALERYRDVRRVASNDIAAMRGEATALLRLGRALEARHVAELLVPMAPGDVDILMLVASTRGEAGDPRGGLAALELARRAAPTRADVQRHIGDLAWKLRDTDAAITAYRSALQIDPHYAVARYQLANVLMERSLWLDAERELLLALDAVPTYGEATLALSRLLRRVGRPEDALPLLIDLLQRDLYHFDGLITLGETLLELGKRDDANYAFKRVLRFDPEHVGALYHEGAILAEQERYREAVERFQKVVDMAPGTEYARKARRDIKSATDLGRRFAKQAG